MIPSWFVQKHGDKFHQTVVLRSGMSTVPCKVQLTVVYTTSGIPEIKLGRGWRDFATYNRLVVGDSLIFELRRMSEFAVHIFRATGNANGLPSSNAESKKCYTDSELSQKNGNDDSSAGYSSPQHILAAQRSGGSTDGVRDGTAKRIEIGAEGTDVSVSTLQKPPCISLHQGPVLENMQMTPLQHDTQYFSQEPPIDHVEPSISMPDESAQITPPRRIHVRDEFQQPARVLLPSFTQRLVSYNVQDAVGNTCGAFLVSSMHPTFFLCDLVFDDR
ncbi:hypothetical protein KC19_4G033000 [Ceratodon purpureus]|nr:hypothetical protein KC19_4G033000 [Ceratodon purpureus]